MPGGSVTNKFPLATERILLRRLVPSDLANFQDYRHDEEVGQYQGWSPQSDTEAAIALEKYGAAKFFQPGVWFQIGIADRETDALIGDIGVCLSAKEPEAEFGFTLRRQSQGSGLASEAIGALMAFLFAETDIRRIVGITDARNIAAMKLLEKLGMRRLQTNKAIFRGAPCEEHVFILQRPPADRSAENKV